MAQKKRQGVLRYLYISKYENFYTLCNINSKVYISLHTVGVMCMLGLKLSAPECFTWYSL